MTNTGQDHDVFLYSYMFEASLVLWSLFHSSSRPERRPSHEVLCRALELPQLPQQVIPHDAPPVPQQGVGWTGAGAAPPGDEVTH